MHINDSGRVEIYLVCRSFVSTYKFDDTIIFMQVSQYYGPQSERTDATGEK